MSRCSLWRHLWQRSEHAANAYTHGYIVYHIHPWQHHRWHTSNSYLFFTDVTVPSSSPFPYTHQPIPHANKAASLPVALRLGRGMHAVQPSFWGQALPKLHMVGLSIPPPKYIRRGAHPSLSPNPTDPQGPKTTKWATDPIGAQMGVHFAPPFWAHGQVTPEGPTFGGCNFWTPHFGPIWGHLPIFQF